MPTALALKGLILGSNDHSGRACGAMVAPDPPTRTPKSRGRPRKPPSSRAFDPDVVPLSVRVHFRQLPLGVRYDLRRLDPGVSGNDVDDRLASFGRVSTGGFESQRRYDATVLTGAELADRDTAFVK